MVSLLLILLLVAGLATILFWRHQARTEYFTENPVPVPKSLFGPPEGTELSNLEREIRREEILNLASQGDFSALELASNSPQLYAEAVDVLAARTGTGPLTDFILNQSDLRTTPSLAMAVIDQWAARPDRSGLASMLHVAALTNLPEMVRTAVREAAEAYQSGRLTNVSPKEMAAVIEGEYWELNPDSRGTAEGAALKLYIQRIQSALVATHQSSNNG